MAGLAFGEFVVTLLELRRAGQPVAIEPTPLKLLHYVAAAYPRVVPKAELLEEVWGMDTMVTENAFYQAISKIRKALGDSREASRYIQVVSRRGVRFLEQPISSESTDAERGAAVTRRPPDDRSFFVRDINHPDGGSVFVNDVFEKAWEIRNVGSVPWINRFLSRVGPAASFGRLQSAERVPIPETMPGAACVVRVTLRAPPTPGSCEAYWKMTDETGRLLLPQQSPLYVSIDVVERPSRPHWESE